MVGRRKKQETDPFTGGEEFPNIFEFQGGQRASAPKVEEKEDTGPSVADLLAKIDGLTSTVNALQQASYGQRPTVIVQPQPVAPAPDTGIELPDPMEDLDGFKAGLAKGINAIVQSELERQRTESAEDNEFTGKVDTLWSDFVGAYPKWKDATDQVEFAASRVARAKATRGVNMEQYIFGTPKQFFDDVNAEMVKVFGEPEVEENEEAGEDTTLRKPSVFDSEPDRTGGMFGGSGSPSHPGKAKADKPGDMIKDLTDMQLKSGFY